MDRKFNVIDILLVESKPTLQLNKTHIIFFKHVKMFAIPSVVNSLNQITSRHIAILFNFKPYEQVQFFLKYDIEHGHA
jgi:hypothetical protein